jgi:hypothetical protein
MISIKNCIRVHSLTHSIKTASGTAPVVGLHLQEKAGMRAVLCTRSGGRSYDVV